MIEEATGDACGESEGATGWFTLVEDKPAVPVDTAVLGVPVTVQRMDLVENDGP